MTLARLCAAVDPEAVSLQSVERIRRELPDYRRIDPAEHLEAVRVQQRNQLVALAAGRVVTGRALEQAADLARRRARQGIEVEVLIGAYHVGDQVLWQSLVDGADADTAALLPQAASLMFASLHTLSTAFTAAHAEASEALHTRRVTASQRLVELLAAGSADAEAAAHARTLGLVVDGPYVGLAWVDAEDAAPAFPAEVLRRLEAAGAVFAVGQLAAETLLVCQRIEPTALEAVAVPDSGRGGVGLSRDGLTGAALSLDDARLAATAAVAGPGGERMVRLEAVWPDACVHSQSVRLAALLDPARRVAAEHPHLADAVLAFADADMQLARAAHRLHLHPNSLSYRLDRWRTLTGWHPRTFEDLRRSVLAIRSPAH